MHARRTFLQKLTVCLRCRTEKRRKNKTSKPTSNRQHGERRSNERYNKSMNRKHISAAAEAAAETQTYRTTHQLGMMIVYYFVSEFMPPIRTRRRIRITIMIKQRHTFQESFINSTTASIRIAAAAANAYSSW